MHLTLLTPRDSLLTVDTPAPVTPAPTTPAPVGESEAEKAMRIFSRRLQYLRVFAAVIFREICPCEFAGASSRSGVVPTSPRFSANLERAQRYFQ